MIGSGLKKLAQQHGMTVAGGVVFGSLMGYAATLSEGSGYKRIVISTKMTQTDGQQRLLEAVNGVDVTRQYRVQSLQISLRCIDIVFQDTVGTMKKIEEFIAWFFPILASVATGKLDSKDIVIYSMDHDGQNTIVSKIEIDENFEYTDWPEGVFEEDFQLLNLINRARQ